MKRTLHEWIEIVVITFVIVFLLSWAINFVWTVARPQIESFFTPQRTTEVTP